MKRNKKGLHIRHLIESMGGEANARTEEKVKAWSKRAKENKERAEDLNEALQAFDDHSGESPENVSAIWQTVVERSQEAKRKKNRRRFVYIGIAASLAVLYITVPLLTRYLDNSNMAEDQIVLITESGDNVTLANQEEAIWVDVRKEMEGDKPGNESAEAEISWNTIRIPKGKRYRFILEDGTTVHLNGDSEFRFPSHFPLGKREVHLVGEAFFDVERNEDRPFSVKAGKMDVVALGTSFNVSNRKGADMVRSTLVSGKVRVDASNGERITLEPGEQASLVAGASVHKRRVDTELYTCWMEGKMIFRREKFERIKVRLEDFYGLEIDNRNKELDARHFTLVVKEGHDIGFVLEVIEALYSEDIRFERKKGKVIIH
ncbi:iron dicitrate transporter FecR (plasmid) [Fulvitalea axinellae]|uniref:Iron dicitrate transporter FecR n=1 Tax=Fulvitalea axinellae TaxID=1182444 RepID=A0AAU9DHF0_9BACT|nr:iron dicitrate transporter FecR [Fulvitalea axinellae]